MVISAHLPVLSAFCLAEAPPADSLLRSLYERTEEEKEDQEEKSQEVFGLERSYEISVQQEEQMVGQEEEGWSVSEHQCLLYPLKTRHRTKASMSVQSDAE